MAAFTSKVASFGSGDIASQQADLLRQQQLAQALAQQAQDPLQAPPTPAGGLAVPLSKWSALGKIGQIFGAGLAQQNASDAEKKFNQDKAMKISEALGNWDKIRSGTPDQQVQVFGADPENPTTQTMPGQAPNPRGAALSLLNSGVPELQQFGMQSILTQKGPESMFGKIDPKDYTASSIAKFAQTGSFSDLEPVRKKEFLDTGGGHVAVDPYATAPGAVVKNTGNPFKDLVGLDENGNVVPNQPLVQAKKEISKAGAPNVNVKTDVKMGESLGAQVGPIMKEASEQATAAATQVQVAQNLVKALDSNKIFAGTGADTKLQLAQIGDSLGITGKDTQEKLANTRQLVQSLAQLTLEGRKQMKGQGQVTDQESKLAERAISGDLNFTPTELRVLAGAADRSGRAVYGNYQRKIDALKQNPNVNALAPYYEAQPLPEAAPTQPASQAPQFKILGVR